VAAETFDDRTDCRGRLEGRHDRNRREPSRHAAIVARGASLSLTLSARL
jgi:hypothetical protein